MQVDTPPGMVMFVSTTNDWSEALARTVAREVRRLRGAQGLSAQRLADRCLELGMPSLTRSVLADLENGRRLWVGVAEVMVLARALSTAPIALIYPAPLTEMVEVLPNAPRAPKTVAMEWFSGEVATPWPWICDDADAYRRNLQPIERARERSELESRKVALIRANPGDSTEERTRYFDALADIERRIDALSEDNDNAG